MLQTERSLNWLMVGPGGWFLWKKKLMKIWNCIERGMGPVCSSKSRWYLSGLQWIITEKFDVDILTSVRTYKSQSMLFL